MNDMLTEFSFKVGNVSESLSKNMHGMKHKMELVETDY